MITDAMKEALAPLTKAFKYRRDQDLYGTREYWTTIPLGKVMEGDCEDFSLTVLRNLSGGGKWAMLKMLIKREATLHFVKVHKKDGTYAGHCVLEYNDLFVDNNFRAWVSQEYMEKRGSYSFRYRYYLPMIFANYVWAKLIEFKNNR